MISLEFDDGRVFSFLAHVFIPDDRCLLDINRYYLSPLGKLYFKGYTRHYIFNKAGFVEIDYNAVSHIRSLFDLYSKCTSIRIRKD